MNIEMKLSKQDKEGWWEERGERGKKMVRVGVQGDMTKVHNIFE